jgi:hypothetical protein
VAEAVVPETMHSVIGPRFLQNVIEVYQGFTTICPEPGRVEIGKLIKSEQRADGSFEVDFQILKEGDPDYPKFAAYWLSYAKRESA